MTHRHAQKYQHRLEELMNLIMEISFFYAPHETKPAFEKMLEYLKKETFNAFCFAMRWRCGINEESKSYPYEHIESFAEELARHKEYLSSREE